MADPTGPRAGLGTRLVAALVDGIVIGVPTGLVGSVIGVEPAGYQGLSAVVSVIYFGVLEGMPAGQTLGKRVMSIRVVDATTGGPIDGGSWVRAIVRVISGAACGLGFFWALWDPERQTWHDKAAGCYVVPVSAYPV